MTRHTAQRLAPPLASDSRGRAAHLCKARARITDLLYVLKFILGDFCIVCTGFHCVNFTMFAQARHHRRGALSARARVADAPLFRAVAKLGGSLLSFGLYPCCRPSLSSGASRRWSPSRARRLELSLWRVGRCIGASTAFCNV